MLSLPAGQQLVATSAPLHGYILKALIILHTYIVMLPKIKVTTALLGSRGIFTEQKQEVHELLESAILRNNSVESFYSLVQNVANYLYFLGSGNFCTE